MTNSSEPKRGIQARILKDRSFAENAAHVAGILNKSYMTAEPSPRIELAEADEWAKRFFEDMREYFEIEVLIRKRDRKPSNPRGRETYEAIIANAPSISRLLRATYEWLDNRPLVDEMLAACGKVFLGDTP